MILRARKDGNITVFELEGHLDFETTQQFHDKCDAMMSDTPETEVVFNMEKLKFVGSSGINQFITILKRFNTRKPKPRLCKLSTEFHRMFRAYETTRNPFEIFETEGEAITSFTNPVEKKPRRAAKKPAIETDSGSEPGTEPEADA
jgi:anti-anti-sigma factor